MKHRILAVVLAGACATVAFRGQDPQKPMFVSRRDVVRIDVLVTERGRSVTGLKASDFKVTDNGVPQTIDYVSYDELPVNLMLAFDVSGSMAGPRLDDLRAAGRAVLDLLHPDERAGFVSFSHAVSLGSELTLDRDVVRQALDDGRAWGLTSLVDAIFVGLAFGGDDSGRSLMLVFSDGQDTTSWLEPKTVLEAAKGTSVAVFGVTDGHARQPLLKNLAEITGGESVEVASTNDLRATFSRLLAEFRLRYTIGYSPAGVAAGGWHSLKVAVSRQGAIVKARDGYQAGR